jgi:urease accessory protein
MDAETETYILLLLSDSNLPSGSFVASSGFESYLKHGFTANTPSHPPDGASISKTNKSQILSATTLHFLKSSLHANAHMSIPFVSEAHILVSSLRTSSSASGSEPENRAASRDHILAKLKKLDQLLHIMTLNEVSRRASTTQGVALLTLYSKGFTTPPAHLLPSSDPGPSSNLNDDKSPSIASDHAHAPEDLGSGSEEDPFLPLVDSFKLSVRLGQTHGHLAVCWGILTASLGLSVGTLSHTHPFFIIATLTVPSQITERSQHLSLFLHARSILSSAIRLNSIGPYASQQLLLHSVRPIVESLHQATKHLRVWDAEGNELVEGGPTTTWPLGEIVIGRHDLLQSRIFNS